MAARLSCSPRAPLLALVALVACIVLRSVSGASNYTAVIKCADCAKLWELPRLAQGEEFDMLNAFSGFMHDEVIVLTEETSADLPVAQQMFTEDTLITAPKDTMQTMFLGAYPAGLKIMTGVGLTLQGVDAHNVLATFNTTGGPNGSWSFAVDSVEQQPGSWLRLVRSELVLLDCAVAQALWRAAGLPAAQRPWGWNMTQLLEPEIVVQHIHQPGLHVEGVYISCNQVCDPVTGVRTMPVTTASDLYSALAVVDDNIDGCSAYVIELQQSLSLAAGLMPPPSGPPPPPALAGSMNSTSHHAQMHRRLQRGTGRQRADRFQPRRLDNSGSVTGDAEGGSGTALGGGFRRRLRHFHYARTFNGTVHVQTNVTFRGVVANSSVRFNVSTAIVLDLSYLMSVFVVSPPAVIMFHNITLINLASPLTGVLALPMYVVDLTARIIAADLDVMGVHVNLTSIVLKDAGVVLTPDELAYETTWLRAYPDNPPTLSLQQRLWLNSSVTTAQLDQITSNTMILSLFAGWDIRGYNMHIVSVPPPGQRLLVPAIGIGLVSPTPLSLYPQVVALNSSEALVLVCNSTAGFIMSPAAKPGGQPLLDPYGNPMPNYFAFPGAATAVRINMLPVSATSALYAVKPPHGSTGFVTLQRSVTLGPLLDPVTGGLSSLQQGLPPILDMGSQRVSWGAMADPSYSLTLRNMTIVGLNSPERWPAPYVVRCLDLPLWALSVNRLPSLGGEAPQLIFMGTNVSVSTQELEFWDACYKMLTSPGSLSNNPTLAPACDGLGLKSFRAARLDKHSMLVTLLEGMGMVARDVVLRDDIRPYQRYDLDVLLPDAIQPPPPPMLPGGYFAAEAPPESKKWVIPLAIVVSVAGVTVLLLLATYLKYRRRGGHAAPYVNVHMMRMMADGSSRPYLLHNIREKMTDEEQVALERELERERMKHIERGEKELALARSRSKGSSRASSAGRRAGGLGGSGTALDNAGTGSAGPGGSGAPTTNTGSSGDGLGGAVRSLRARLGLGGGNQARRSRFSMNESTGYIAAAQEGTTDDIHGSGQTGTGAEAAGMGLLPGLGAAAAAGGMAGAAATGWNQDPQQQQQQGWAGGQGQGQGAYGAGGAQGASGTFWDYTQNNALYGGPPPGEQNVEGGAMAWQVPQQQQQQQQQQQHDQYQQEQQQATYGQQQQANGDAAGVNGAGPDATAAAVGEGMNPTTGTAGGDSIPAEAVSAVRRAAATPLLATSSMPIATSAVAKQDLAGARGCLSAAAGKRRILDVASALNGTGGGSAEAPSCGGSATTTGTEAMQHLLQTTQTGFSSPAVTPGVDAAGTTGAAAVGVGAAARPSSTPTGCLALRLQRANPQSGSSPQATGHGSPHGGTHHLYRPAHVGVGSGSLARQIPSSLMQARPTADDARSYGTTGTATSVAPTEGGAALTEAEAGLAAGVVGHSGAASPVHNRALTAPQVARSSSHYSSGSAMLVDPPAIGAGSGASFTSTPMHMVPLADAGVAGASASSSLHAGASMPVGGGEQQAAPSSVSLVDGGGMTAVGAGAGPLCSTTGAALAVHSGNRASMEAADALHSGGVAGSAVPVVSEVLPSAPLSGSRLPPPTGPAAQPSALPSGTLRHQASEPNFFVMGGGWSSSGQSNRRALDSPAAAQYLAEAGGPVAAPHVARPLARHGSINGPGMASALAAGGGSGNLQDAMTGSSLRPGGSGHLLARASPSSPYRSAGGAPSGLRTSAFMPTVAAAAAAAAMSTVRGRGSSGNITPPRKPSIEAYEPGPQAGVGGSSPRGGSRRPGGVVRLSEAENRGRTDSSRSMDGSGGGAVGGGGAAAAGGKGDKGDALPAAPPSNESLKANLSKLLVGSLSTLFSVDGLAGAVQASKTASQAAGGTAGASGGSVTAGSQSSAARRVSALQLAESGRGGGGSNGLAPAGRMSMAAGAGVGGAAGSVMAAGGGLGMAGRTAGMAASNMTPGAALSELTADMENRLNENQLVIQQVLGSGAFGTVYKALWKGLQVAVKTMTLTADAVTQGRHAALMEAALSKSIFHPNVVTTYTCDLKPMHVDSRRGGAMTGLQIMNETQVIQEWRLYIVQEFCDGGSLRHAIQARSFLNTSTGAPQMEWVLQMAREIASGLQYLHERNIIHGDLNPANVLLKREDASVLGYTAKIADFGLSVHMHAEQSHVSNTKRGTPFYTAPEVTNAGNLTRFADVFSYGVVLWELYCSRCAWTYGPQGRLVHQRGFPHLPPSCPRAYAQLVSICMQPAHKQRPTFKQVGNMIDSMLRECERAYAATAGYASGGGGNWWSSGGGGMPPQHQQQQMLMQGPPQGPPQGAATQGQWQEGYGQMGPGLGAQQTPGPWQMHSPMQSQSQMLPPQTDAMQPARSPSPFGHGMAYRSSAAYSSSTDLVAVDSSRSLPPPPDGSQPNASPLASGPQAPVARYGPPAYDRTNSQGSTGGGLVGRGSLTPPQTGQLDGAGSAAIPAAGAVAEASTAAVGVADYLGNQRSSAQSERGPGSGVSTPGSVSLVAPNFSRGPSDWSNHSAAAPPIEVVAAGGSSGGPQGATAAGGRSASASAGGGGGSSSSGGLPAGPAATTRAVSVTARSPFAVAAPGTGLPRAVSPQLSRLSNASEVGSSSLPMPPALPAGSAVAATNNGSGGATGTVFLQRVGSSGGAGASAAAVAAATAAAAATVTAAAAALATGQPGGPLACHDASPGMSAEVAAGDCKEGAMVAPAVPDVGRRGSAELGALQAAAHQPSDAGVSEGGLIIVGLDHGGMGGAVPNAAAASAAASGGGAGSSGDGSGGGGGLTSVMRGFEIPAEVPRFGRPDLPTVMETEDGDGEATTQDTLLQEPSGASDPAAPPSEDVANLSSGLPSARLGSSPGHGPNHATSDSHGHGQAKDATAASPAAPPPHNASVGSTSSGTRATIAAALAAGIAAGNAGTTSRYQPPDLSTVLETDEGSAVSDMRGSRLPSSAAAHGTAAAGAYGGSCSSPSARGCGMDRMTALALAAVLPASESGSHAASLNASTAAAQDAVAAAGLGSSEGAAGSVGLEDGRVAAGSAEATGETERDRGVTGDGTDPGSGQGHEVGAVAAMAVAVAVPVFARTSIPLPTPVGAAASADSPGAGGALPPDFGRASVGPSSPASPLVQAPFARGSMSASTPAGGSPAGARPRTPAFGRTSLAPDSPAAQPAPPNFARESAAPTSPYGVGLPAAQDSAAYAAAAAPAFARPSLGLSPGDIVGDGTATMLPPPPPSHLRPPYAQPLPYGMRRPQLQGPAAPPTTPASATAATAAGMAAGAGSPFARPSLGAAGFSVMPPAMPAASSSAAKFIRASVGVSQSEALQDGGYDQLPPLPTPAAAMGMQAPMPHQAPAPMAMPQQAPGTNPFSRPSWATIKRNAAAAGLPPTGGAPGPSFTLMAAAPQQQPAAAAAAVADPAGNRFVRASMGVQQTAALAEAAAAGAQAPYGSLVAGGGPFARASMGGVAIAYPSAGPTAAAPAGAPPFVRPSMNAPPGGMPPPPPPPPPLGMPGPFPGAGATVGPFARPSTGSGPVVMPPLPVRGPVAAPFARPSLGGTMGAPPGPLVAATGAAPAGVGAGPFVRPSYGSPGGPAGPAGQVPAAGGGSAGGVNPFVRPSFGSPGGPAGPVGGVTMAPPGGAAPFVRPSFGSVAPQPPAHAQGLPSVLVGAELAALPSMHAMHTSGTAPHGYGQQQPQQQPQQPPQQPQQQAMWSSAPAPAIAPVAMSTAATAATPGDIADAALPRAAADPNAAVAVRAPVRASIPASSELVDDSNRDDDASTHFAMSRSDNSLTTPASPAGSASPVGPSALHQAAAAAAALTAAAAAEPLEPPRLLPPGSGSAAALAPGAVVQLGGARGSSGLSAGGSTRGPRSLVAPPDVFGSPVFATGLALEASSSLAGGNASLSSAVVGSLSGGLASAAGNNSSNSLMGAAVSTAGGGTELSLAALVAAEVSRTGVDATFGSTMESSGQSAGSGRVLDAVLRGGGPMPALRGAVPQPTPAAQQQQGQVPMGVPIPQMQMQMQPPPGAVRMPGFGSVGGGSGGGGGMRTGPFMHRSRTGVQRRASFDHASFRFSANGTMMPVMPGADGQPMSPRQLHLQWQSNAALGNNGGVVPANDWTAPHYSAGGAASANILGGGGGGGHGNFGRMSASGVQSYTSMPLYGSFSGVGAGNGYGMSRFAAGGGGGGGGGSGPRSFHMSPRRHSFHMQQQQAAAYFGQQQQQALGMAPQMPSAAFDGGSGMGGMGMYSQQQQQQLQLQPLPMAWGGQGGAVYGVMGPQSAAAVPGASGPSTIPGSAPVAAAPRFQRDSIRTLEASARSGAATGGPDGPLSGGPHGAFGSVGDTKHSGFLRVLKDAVGGFRRLSLARIEAEGGAAAAGSSAALMSQSTASGPSGGRGLPSGTSGGPTGSSAVPPSFGRSALPLAEIEAALAEDVAISGVSGGADAVGGGGVLKAPQAAPPGSMYDPFAAAPPLLGVPYELNEAGISNGGGGMSGRVLAVHTLGGHGHAHGVHGIGGHGGGNPFDMPQGDSLDEALRLAKTSLSTVLESNATFSRTCSIAPSSQSSMVASGTMVGAAPGEPGAPSTGATTPGRFHRRSAAATTGSAGAAGATPAAAGAGAGGAKRSPSRSRGASLGRRSRGSLTGLVEEAHGELGAESGPDAAAKRSGEAAGSRKGLAGKSKHKPQLLLDGEGI